MAVVRSKRKTTVQKDTRFYSADGALVKKCYCRRCMEMKLPKFFLEATDTYLDKNGKMSVCTECLDDIFSKVYGAEKDISKTLLFVCRLMNVAYSDSAVQYVISHFNKMQERGANLTGVFGVYKSKLITMSSLNSLSTSFTEPSSFSLDKGMEDGETEHSQDLKQFWGDLLTYEDYVWLEAEFAEWKKTHKVDTRSEISLLKMIVLKLLDIRKARAEQKNSAELEKQFQDLLKTSALSPAQTNAASQGKTADTWGMITKMIEEEEPAEHYKDYKLFDDFFGIKKYCRDYISRPILNFFSGQKNYEINDDNELSFEDDQSDSQDIKSEEG